MKSNWPAATMLVLGAVVAGCTRHSSTPTTQSSAETSASVDGSRFLIAVEPDGAEDVVTARETANDGDDVLVVGRIGGSDNPWIEGRAAFSIVDASLTACNEIPGDQCETPWDYCCATDKLPTRTALVKIVDENGDVVKSGARELLNVRELSTVVIQGKARRDDAGNLTVLTRGVYVRTR